MRQDVKKFFTNLATVLLALEIRSFFEKGGSHNDLAFTILKILFLGFFGICVMNMEDVTKVIVHKLDKYPEANEVPVMKSLTKFLKATAANK
jgi:hypothetical protein